MNAWRCSGILAGWRGTTTPPWSCAFWMPGKKPRSRIFSPSVLRSGCFLWESRPGKNGDPASGPPRFRQTANWWRKSTGSFFNTGKPVFPSRGLPNIWACRPACCACAFTRWPEVRWGNTSGSESSNIPVNSSRVPGTRSARLPCGADTDPSFLSAGPSSVSIVWPRGSIGKWRPERPLRPPSHQAGGRGNPGIAG